MTTQQKTLWERITTAVRCFFNRSVPPETIMERKQQELAAVQAEGPKEAQRRDKLRWGDEGPVADTTGMGTPVGSKR